MTENRFKVHNMLKSFVIGEDTDLEILQELVEEYGSTAKIELFITDNGKQMTYEETETLLNHFYNENEQLKQDIRELQNDKLLTELQMKCDKKQEHIVVLENKIRRMRGAIHKLEWLATHRNGELIRENKQLKEFIKGLCVMCGASLEQQYKDKKGDVE